MNMMSSISTRDGPGLVAARLDKNPIQTEENAKMTSKQLFTKKTLKGEVDENQETTLQPQTGDTENGEQPDRKPNVKKTKKPGPGPSKDDAINVGNDTIRLSCDLPRCLHTSLRVAAALSERSILGLIEALIVKHLLDKPSDQIIAAYHKSNDSK